MLDKKLTMDDIHFAIKNSYGNEPSCAFSDYNDDHLIFRLRMENIAQTKKSGGGGFGGGGGGHEMYQLVHLQVYAGDHPFDKEASPLRKMIGGRLALGSRRVAQQIGQGLVVDTQLQQPFVGLLRIVQGGAKPPAHAVAEDALVMIGWQTPRVLRA